MPRSVWWFEKLMWASLLLSPFIAVLDWDRLLHKAAPNYVYGDRIQVEAASFTMTVTLIFTFLVLSLFVWLIARERMNWARWVFAAMFVLGIPFVVIGFPEMLMANPAAGVLSLVQGVMEITALALVFSSNARPWFTRTAVGIRPT